MKRILFIASAVLLLTPQLHAAGWNQSIAAAQKKAQASKELIFVDLFADWCGWCHKMEQEVFPSAAFQQQTDDMVLLRLNTEDNGDGTKLARQYSVTSLPTFLVLTSDLSLAGTIHGYLPSKEFVDALKDVEVKYRTFEKDVASEPSFANDYSKRYELAREFNSRFQPLQAEVRFKKLVADRKTPVEFRDKAYFELAIAQVMQGRYDDATQTLEAFAKVQPSGDMFERGRVLEAQILAEQGKTAAALSVLKAFRKKYPNSPLIGNVNMMIPQLERSVVRK